MYSLHVFIFKKGCTDDPRCERSIKTIENNPHREAVIKKLCDNGQFRDLCPKTCNACK